MKIQHVGTMALAAGMAVAASGIMPAPARACGGFFCSAANPVNQAAEQIIFSDNGDGTTTAVIQIMYEGPSTKFAWLLPVPGIPDVEVSSNMALDRLNAATNPQYQLNTVFEGDCAASRGFGIPGSSPAPAAFDSDGAAGGSSPVMVLATKQVGPYDSIVISVDASADDAAQVAVDWLTNEGYDVTDVGPDVLRPYLDAGMNLVAFRLTKGSSSGSIRPVMITYDGDLPSIPIRPTAVAATDNMGVKVWVLSKERAIPKNYKGLVLNEALIDWFNPNNNYNEVVSKAADEAGGQGFVTEFAGATDVFDQTIVMQWERDTWTKFSSTTFTSDIDMVREAMSNWGGWDGFDRALDKAVSLPADVDFEDFKLCFLCYADDAGFAFDRGVFLQELYDGVTKPVFETQKLLDDRSYMTRLYTTMSADEMTLDPVFDFNPDLEDVANLHVADRIVSCDDIDPISGEQTWRVDLAQGDSVRGTTFGVWPIELEDQPAALQILQFGTSGQGEMVTDNSDMVANMVDDQNDVTMGRDDATGDTKDDGDGAVSSLGGDGDGEAAGSEGNGPAESGEMASSGGKSSTCAVGAGPGGGQNVPGTGFLVGLLGLLLWRRRALLG